MLDSVVVVFTVRPSGSVCCTVFAVEKLRARKVDDASPSVYCVPTRTAAATSGKRVEVVRSVLPPAVISVNSGAYWKKIPPRPQAPSAAGLIGETGSVSPRAPAVPRARVLSWPGG